MGEWHRRVDTILAHPDDSIRMKAIQKILKKETRTDDLNDWVEAIGKGHQGERLKVKILKCWVTDPSETIRRYIAMTTTNTKILEILSTDISTTVSQIAYPKYKKFQKCDEYSKAYNKRK